MCMRSKHELEQLDGSRMINFKIFFEYSLKSSLDEIKKIILSPTPQIPQTIHNTLPNRVTFQYDQVLLH